MANIEPGSTPAAAVVRDEAAAPRRSLDDLALEMARLGRSTRVNPPELPPPSRVWVQRATLEELEADYQNR